MSKRKDASWKIWDVEEKAAFNKPKPNQLKLMILHLMVNIASK
jgi:hypothetical protein